jgi:hypothetical protein
MKTQLEGVLNEETLIAVFLSLCFLVQCRTYVGKNHSNLMPNHVPAVNKRQIFKVSSKVLPQIHRRVDLFNKLIILPLFGKLFVVLF